MVVAILPWKKFGKTKRFELEDTVGRGGGGMLGVAGRDRASGPAVSAGWEDTDRPGSGAE